VNEQAQIRLTQIHSLEGRLDDDTEVIYSVGQNLHIK